MSLFCAGDFVAHSGDTLPYKIDCDFLTRDDWWSLAVIIARLVDPFVVVEGVERGGSLLAGLLSRLTSDTGGLLIVDDVWTTGASMRQQRGERQAQGAVVFARDHVEDWVTPVFLCDKALI